MAQSAAYRESGRLKVIKSSETVTAKKHSKGLEKREGQSVRWTDDEATTLERVSCVSSSASREQLLGGQSTRPSPPQQSTGSHTTIKSIPRGSLGLVWASGGVGKPGMDSAVRTTGQSFRPRQKTRT